MSIISRQTEWWTDRRAADFDTVTLTYEHEQDLQDKTYFCDILFLYYLVAQREHVNIKAEKVHQT